MISLKIRRKEVFWKSIFLISIYHNIKCIAFLLTAPVIYKILDKLHKTIASCFQTSLTVLNPTDVWEPLFPCDLLVILMDKYSLITSQGCHSETIKKNLVWHSHNFLLLYITVEEYFFVNIIFIFNSYFCAFYLINYMLL